MLKELKKNKMSVVATGILFGVMGVLIIPMIAVIVKISNALSQKHPRIYKYSMIAFIGMLLAIDPADVDKTMEALKAAGETCYELGQVESGEKCAELV